MSTRLVKIILFYKKLNFQYLASGISGHHFAIKIQNLIRPQIAQIVADKNK